MSLRELDTTSVRRKTFCGYYRPRRAHLVGVAGNGMRALADVLVEWGWPISGSDLNLASVKHLAGRATLFENHAADHLPPDAELVVHSDAVPSDNPELRLAAERGVEALSYFEMLGRLGAGRDLSAVAGTHGKSTVVAMAAHVLVRAGLDPTVVCGGAVLGAASGGRAGGEDMMLVEACEYRANFLRLRPRRAVILNIEPDHFDCYDSPEELEAAFGRFAVSLPADGLLLANSDCPATRRAAAAAKCRIETFGLSPDADWTVRDVAQPPPAVMGEFYISGDDSQPGAAVLQAKSDGRGFMGVFQFEIRRFGRRFCEVRMRMPGKHNVLNALAAAALAHANGVSEDEISAGLSDFPGLHRRMELLGSRHGVAMIDDYAHHPTEVRAALAAARSMYPNCRLWSVFQPHQVSRTARLLDELAESLQNADKLLVSEVYRAREQQDHRGVEIADRLARAAEALGVEVLPGRSDKEIAATLETQLVSGDVLITLGAGEVGGLRPWRGEDKKDTYKTKE